jgi:extracellular matrix regulatory protein A
LTVELVAIGFGNAVAMNRVVAVLAPNSAPIRRIIQQAKERGSLIDTTYGRKTKSVIVLDSGHVMVAALQPETVLARLDHHRQGAKSED